MTDTPRTYPSCTCFVGDGLPRQHANDCARKAMTDTPMTPDAALAPWGRDDDGRPMLPMGAHWTDIPELLDQHLAGIQGRVDQAQPGPWFASPTAAAPDTVCTRYDGYTRTVGQLTNMLPGDLELVLHAHSDLRWSLDLIAKLRARVAELEAATGTVRAMHRKHTDSEHCQYDDMTWPCPTVTALGDPGETAELAEGTAGLDAMRADHPAPCRIPDSPDCTCPDEEVPATSDSLRAALRGHLFGGGRGLDQR